MMKLNEIEKGIDIIERTFDRMCTVKTEKAVNCADCPFYNSMAEMPCEIVRFGFPLVRELKQYVKESKECLI